MRTVGLVAAAWLAVTAGCMSHVQRAEELAAAGDARQAQALLEAVLAETEGDTDARLALARLHVAAKRWVDGENALRLVLDAQPSRREARELLAHVLLELGSHAQAAFQLGRLRELHGRESVPDDRFRKVLMDAAETLLGAGEYSGGIRLLDRAIEEGLVPYESQRVRLSAAWSARATRLTADGLRDAAVDAWASAQQHDATNPAHPLARGRLLVEINRFIDARTAFDEHIRLAGESPTSRAAAAHRVARWFEKRGVPTTAADYFEEAGRMDPKRSESVLALARQRLELRDQRRAKLAFARYVKLEGESAKAWRRVGREARALGARRLAEEYLSNAILLDTGDLASATGLAGLLSARGARDDARAVMRTYIDARPDEGNAAFAAGEWAAGQDDSTFAIESYERSAKHNPARTITFLRLYSLYRAAGQPENADRSLNRYVAAADDKAAGHATVADRLRIERRYDQAAKHLHKALAVRGRDPGLWRSLARVHRDARQPELEEKARLELIKHARDPGTTLLSIGKDYRRREDWARALRFFDLAAARDDLPLRRRQDALYLLGEVRWKTRDRPGMRAADRRFVELATGPDAKARALARLENRYRAATLMEDQRWSLLEQIRLQPSRGELHLRLGTLQLRRGDKDSADSAFRKYVAKSGDKVRALHAVATRYRRANDYDAALAAYRRIREVAPGDPRYLQYTADIYRSRQQDGDRERAAKLYDELLSSDAADKLDLGKLGHQLFLGDYFAQAAKAYERGIGKGALRGIYALELGTCQLRLGKIERAREVFEGWLEGEGKGGRSHLEVARKYRDAHMYTDALRHYQQVMNKVGPELEQAYSEAADVLSARGDRKGLQRITEAYLKDARNEVRAREQAAEKLAQGGLPGAAVAQWRRVLALRPNSAVALKRLTGLLYSLGRADEASNYVARLIEEAGGDPRSWLEAGDGLRNKGEFEAALEFYGRALSPKTSREEIQLKRGDLFLALGRWDEARQAFDDGLAAARSKRAPLEKVGNLYEQYDRVEDTLAHWVRATTLDPSHPDHHVRLIAAHLRRGELQKARRALLAARAHAPGGMTRIAQEFDAAGHIAFAAQLYEEVLEAGLEQHLRDAFTGLMTIRLGQGLPETLGPAIQRFVTTARKRAQAHQIVATAFADAGLYDRAFAYARLGAREDPDSAALAATAAYALADNRDDEALDALVGRIRVHRDPSADADAVVIDLVGRGRRDLALRLIDRLEVDGVADAQEDRQLALLRLAAGDLPGALRAARRHIADAADSSAAKREMAHVLFERGLQAEAAELLAEAVAAPDSQSEILVELAEVLFELGDVAGGREALDKWVAAEAEGTTPGQVQLMAGALLHGAGQFEESSRRLREATTHANADGARQALRLRLLSLGASGQGPDALRKAVKAYVAIRPNRKRAYQDAVSVLYTQNRLELAVEFVREGLDRFPGSEKLVGLKFAVHLRRGDTTATRAAVEEHLVHQKKPRDSRLAELAQGFELQLRWDEAARLWRQLLKLSPGSRRLLLSAARAEMMAGREKDAIEAIDEYVCDGPSCDDTPRRAARALLAAGANKAALVFATKAVERRPEDPLGRFLAAVVAMQMGQRDLESESRYLSLAADSDQARIFLARRLLFSGRAPRLGSPQPPRDWIDSARTLLAVPPSAQGDPPEARLWRLVADASVGDADAAERLAQALPRLPPAFKADPLDDRAPSAPSPPPKNAALVADILLREGATEPADTALRLWVSRSEKPASTLHQGAFEMARSRGSGPLMKRWLDELDRRYPDHHAKVTLLAEALEASGDHDGAEATYRQALAHNPRAGVYMNNLAYLFSRRRRDLEEGLRLVRYAEQLQPVSNKFYYDTEGWVLYRLGRLDEARARIWASIRLMNAAMGPTVSESFFHLGSVSADLGRQSEAHWAFRTAAVLDPWGEYGRRSAQALVRLSGETPDTPQGKPAN